MAAIGIATDITSLGSRTGSPVMSKPVCALVAGLWMAAALGADVQPSADTRAPASATRGVPDSKQIEGDLQRLPWKQFRSVVESVPKIKADVDVYGPLGWKYVEANYKTYGWKKSIDKLDEIQKQNLVDLIQRARGAR